MKHLDIRIHENTNVGYWLKFLDDTEKAQKTGEDAQQLRVCLVRIFLDKSYSIHPYEDKIFHAVHCLLDVLAAKNASSLDMKYRVQIIFFNDKIEELNTVPLAPQQVAELFVREKMNAEGTTPLHVVMNYQDKSYTHSNKLVMSQKKGDFKIADVMITDCCATDSQESRDAAMKRLNTNRLRKQVSDQWCIFLGSDSDKETAALLTGSPNRVIALDANLSEFLAPTLIEGTVSETDATHIDDDVEETPVEMAKRTVEREQEGESTATQLTGKELSDKLAYLLGMD